MFLQTQTNQNIENYTSALKAIGAFSNLFSSSDKPFIQYRVAENAFCKAFGADNLARADVAYDAIINGCGVGIKTFVLSGSSKIEKVAEFNSRSSELRMLKGLDLANKLADFRNERIEFADRLYNTQNRVYHIIGRDKLLIKVFETSYDLIDKNSIEILEETKSSLKFKDALNEYNFNFSKSVLMKRFIIPLECIEINVEILEEPINVLLNLAQPSLNKQTDAVKVKLQNAIGLLTEEELIPFVDYVILPLYSPEAKKKLKEPIVPIKSQLNQWNAGGRKRDPGEVYISIPSKIRNNAPDFFPEKDVIFNLKIPNGKVLSAKVCQDGSKALMTNPNKAMADWMLRDVLMLNENEVLTYDKLRKIGYDSVKITKSTEQDYFIDFTKLDEYESFIEKISETQDGQFKLSL
ncbi:restriction endonuclease [Flavobacterium sp. KACC 22758]|uniref:restriction endonuclease n=1 Tax=Flavobacterium sp. KACC 22758 TaxID=3025667 RepID=UPI00236638F8|nr:restriction endonuclease [Flavobacterium sp. KACC 22758]WDF59407.1 restriction endonuclease [Flavobacterium sp. KACC 22758]